MKHGELLAMLTAACILLALNSAASPFYAVGTEYALIDLNHTGLGGILTLFNNTLVSFDYEGNGIWDATYLGNAGDLIDLDRLDPARAAGGALIKSNKPIEYFQALRQLNTVPPLGSLAIEYILSPGDWKAISDKSMTLTLDLENRNSIHGSVRLERLGESVFTVPEGKFMKVNGGHRFLVYSDMIMGPPGKEFNIPSDYVKNFIVPEDRTTISVDLDNDGVFDWNQTFNAGITGGYTFSAGARIASDKNIVVLGRLGFADVQYIPPSNMTGDDIWSKSKSDSTIVNPMKVKVYLDAMQENDLWPEQIFENESVIELPYLGRHHIWSDSRIMEAYSDNSLFPYSQVSSVDYPVQNRQGASEIVPIQFRIMNPYGNRTVENITFEYSLPAGFTLHEEKTFTIRVEKRRLRDDAILDRTDVKVAPIKARSYIQFRMDQKSAAILDKLEPMAYVSLEFTAVTPNKEGDYSQNPPVVGYAAGR
ncbi:MAG: hypothetical protein V1921_01030 [Candidatus Altiarchaeota archaeon]